MYALQSLNTHTHTHTLENRRLAGIKLVKRPTAAAGAAAAAAAAAGVGGANPKGHRSASHGTAFPKTEQAAESPCRALTEEEEEGGGGGQQGSGRARGHAGAAVHVS